jgi:hypothetical protein
VGAENPRFRPRTVYVPARAAKPIGKAPSEVIAEVLAKAAALPT